jgi:protocatechuate 3,4-dioxygenase beta subunit
MSEAPAEPLGPPATLTGSVLRAGDGTPVAKAVITFRRADRGAQAYGATTDASGRFTATGVQAGRYRVTIERQGYSPYGQQSANPTTGMVNVTAGQDVTGLVYRLVPGGVVTGRVLDEDGEPTAGVRVQLQRYRYNQGRRQVVSAGNATTNDLGEYRMYGITPGRYYVSASYQSRMRPFPGNEQDIAYSSVYYPGAPDLARALALELGAGAELRGIDFRLRPAPTVRVRGRVTGLPAGTAAMVTLVSADDAGGGMAARGRSQIDSSGNFEFRGVTPGNYIVLAQAGGGRGGRGMGGGASGMRGRTAVQVGSGDLENVQVYLSGPVNVAGAVRLDGEGQLPANLRVTLQPGASEPMGMPAQGQAQSDGSFVLPQVMPGTYDVRVAGLSGTAYLKSIRLGSADFTERGLEIGPQGAGGLDLVVSLDGATVEGTVTNREQEPIVATIALVPSGPRASLPQLYKISTSDASGKFTLQGIAPGDYKVFAWEEIEQGSWFDPDVIKRYDSFGQSVNLREKGRETVQIKAVAGQK